MTIRSVFVSLLLSSFALTSSAELTPSSHHGHHSAALDVYKRALVLPGPSALSPAVDPFYLPPKNWKNKKNGEILRSRQVKAYGTGVRASYQLLYRTSSVNGTALAAVTHIWVPQGAFNDRLVLASRPENAVAIDCAPSWRFINGTVDDQRFFDKKWVVTSVDHEGPDSAFGAGRTQGRIVLDAGRAVLAFPKLKMKPKTKVAIAGYSGGAGAAGWAATLAASYAPDLNVVGAAYGGVPADMDAILNFVDGKLYAGLAFLGAFGVGRGYQAFDRRLNSILTADGRAVQKLASEKCLSEAFQVIAGKKLLSYNTTSLGPSLLKDSVVAPILASLKMGADPKETPKFPQLIYNGVQDQIIPIASVDALVDRLCASGANLVYRRTLLADHFADVTDADVVPFIEQRFAGVEFPKGCRKTSALFPWIPSNANSAKPITQKMAVPKIADDSSFDDDDRELAAAQAKSKALKEAKILKLHGEHRGVALREAARRLNAL